jgi:hypothetical protein
VIVIHASVYPNIMSESPPHAADERDTKAARLEHPSGFLYDPSRERPDPRRRAPRPPAGAGVTKTEFADHAGITRQTVSTYVDLLLEVDVLEAVPNTSPQRYRLADSEVVEGLFALNSALNAA